MPAGFDVYPFAMHPDFLPPFMMGPVYFFLYAFAHLFISPDCLQTPTTNSRKTREKLVKNWTLPIFALPVGMEFYGRDARDKGPPVPYADFATLKPRTMPGVFFCQTFALSDTALPFIPCR